MFFFFFSSRRRHTRCGRDWSSDVCSSDLGSLLFEEICELPEYYLTRTERAILTERAAEIAALFPEETALVELGSGSAAKTRLLIEAFLERRARLCYMPVDISPTILEDSSRALMA